MATSWGIKYQSAFDGGRKDPHGYTWGLRYYPHRCSWREVYILNVQEICAVIVAAKAERVGARNLDTERYCLVVPVPRLEIAIFKTCGLQASQVEWDAEGFAGCEARADQEGEKCGQARQTRSS